MEYQCRDLTGLFCPVRLFHHLRALDSIGGHSWLLMGRPFLTCNLPYASSQENISLGSSPIVIRVFYFLV